MTPKQLKKLLKDSGLSQRGAARLIGIGERTMRRYIAGELPVPQTVELALYAAILASVDPRVAAQTLSAKHGTKQVRADLGEIRQWLSKFRAALESREPK